jgi:hypothetical protein
LDLHLILLLLLQLRYMFHYLQKRLHLLHLLLLQNRHKLHFLLKILEVDLRVEYFLLLLPID